MPRRRDADHLVGVDFDPLELVERRFVFHEADIYFAVHDLTRNLVQPAAVDADLDVRELLQVACEAAPAADRRRQTRGPRSPASRP